MVRSIGGITIGNSWMRNNPDLKYPDNHEQMDDATLEKALRSAPPSFENHNNVDWKEIGNQPFLVLDKNFGYWSESGFVSDPSKAKVYKKKTLKKSELDSINNGNVLIMSA